MTLIFSAALDKDVNSQAARGNEKVADPCSRQRETFSRNYQRIATFIILFEEPEGSYVNPGAKKDEGVTGIATSACQLVPLEHRKYRN
jgi:hypothetical protein